MRRPLWFLLCAPLAMGALAGCSPGSSSGSANAGSPAAASDPQLDALKQWWVSALANANCNTGNGTDQVEPPSYTACRNVTIKCVRDEALTPADQANGLQRKTWIGVGYIAQYPGGAEWKDEVRLEEFAFTNGNWQKISTGFDLGALNASSCSSW